MSKADDIFWRRFGMILVLLTLFGFVVAFIARSIAGDAHEASISGPNAVAARIAPIGEVRVGDPSKVVAAAPAASAAMPESVATASAAVDGEQVYNTACMACHASGAAGAPKKGDDAAWAPRIALGEDVLVNSVLKGKGAMPAKAGNPALNEEQIRAAVRHLMGTADSGAMATGKEMVAAATASVKEVASAAADTAQAAVDQAKEMASDAGSAMATAAAPAAANTGKPGNEVYNMACVACHATGAANAPKLNDKAAWEPRAATGFAALLQSVLKGKGAMPAKGGLSNLSDADVENAVHYMLKEAGVEAGS